MRIRRRYRARLGAAGRALAVGCLSALAGARGAHASVAVLLEQPYGELSVVYPAGHSAIYFDHICAETPIKLRPCRAGELGVVVSRYDGIGGYDWLATPLIPYLYAVESAAQIPASVDREAEARLRDEYRRRYLEAFAPDRDGKAPQGNWYELVGSAYDRTIYGFQVKSTSEQDASVIALFNDRKNTEHYNGMFRNCADFSRVAINRFYPHAVRRNFVADLGMSSPKSVARGLSHYARKHPEAGLTVFVVPQVKGLSRSWAAVDFTEGVLKRYIVPLAVFSPTATAVVFGAYVGQGRFAMPKNAPVLDVTVLEAEARLAMAPTLTVVDLPLSELPALAPPVPAAVSLVSVASGASSPEADAGLPHTATPLAAIRAGLR